MTNPTTDENLAWLDKEIIAAKFATEHSNDKTVGYKLIMLERTRAQLLAGHEAVRALAPFADLLNGGTRSVETSDRVSFPTANGCEEKGIVCMYWRSDFVFGKIDELNAGIRAAAKALTSAKEAGII